MRRFRANGIAVSRMENCGNSHDGFSIPLISPTPAQSSRTLHPIRGFGELPDDKTAAMTRREAQKSRCRNPNDKPLIDRLLGLCSAYVRVP